MSTLAAIGALLSVPWALESGRNLLEDVGFDPTGRKHRAGNAALGAALGEAGQGLDSTTSLLREEMLSKMLEGSGNDPWAGMGPGMSAEAEQITRPFRKQLASLSAEGRSGHSLTELVARAGLL